MKGKLRVVESIRPEAASIPNEAQTGKVIAAQHLVPALCLLPAFVRPEDLEYIIQQKQCTSKLAKVKFTFEVRKFYNFVSINGRQWKLVITRTNTWSEIANTNGTKSSVIISQITWFKMNSM